MPNASAIQNQPEQHQYESDRPDEEYSDEDLLVRGDRGQFADRARYRLTGRYSSFEFPDRNILVGDIGVLIGNTDFSQNRWNVNRRYQVSGPAVRNHIRFSAPQFQRSGSDTGVGGYICHRR